MYIGKGLVLIVIGIVGIIATIIWVTSDRKLRSQREADIVKEAVSQNIGEALSVDLDVMADENETESLFGNKNTVGINPKGTENMDMKVLQNKASDMTGGLTQGLSQGLTQGVTDEFTQGLTDGHSDELTEGLAADDGTQGLTRGLM